MTPGLVLLVIRVVLGLILYAFLGTLLLFLWKEIQSHRASETRNPPAVLVLADGSDVEGRHSLFDNNRIGRAADNSLVLHDETASAHHARLSFQDGQWWLEDLGSRNGTAVNGIPLEGPLVVTYGDQIAFGRVEFRMEAPVVDDSLE
ncbi:MAG: FHA domain-containing protein [Anaerolineales bacterium]